jgi:hypothetical protein
MPGEAPGRRDIRHALTLKKSIKKLRGLMKPGHAAPGRRRAEHMPTTTKKPEENRFQGTWLALRTTAQAIEQLAREVQELDAEGSAAPYAVKQAGIDVRRLTLACLDLAVSVGRLQAEVPAPRV